MENLFHCLHCNFKIYYYKETTSPQNSDSLIQCLVLIFVFTLESRIIQILIWLVICKFKSFNSSFHLCLHTCFFNFFFLFFLDLDIGLDSRVHKIGLNFTLQLSRRGDTWWQEFPSFLRFDLGLKSFFNKFLCFTDRWSIDEDVQQCLHTATESTLYPLNSTSPSFGPCF